MAVTVQDLLKDPRYKDNKSLLLLAKPDIFPPKPRKKRKQKSRLDKVEDKLNLILKRLDKYDELFRAHGWIK